MTENDGGFLVPDEYVSPLVFKIKHPAMMIQKRVNRKGIVGRVLRAIGNEYGWVYEDTPEYLEFKAQWEREHAKK